MAVCCSEVLVCVTKSTTFIHSFIILKQVVFDDCFTLIHRESGTWEALEV